MRGLATTVIVLARPLRRLTAAGAVKVPSLPMMRTRWAVDPVTPLVRVTLTAYDLVWFTACPPSPAAQRL